MNINAPNWIESDLTDVLEDLQENKSIIVYNDEYNSFEHVIRCLVIYCEHSPEQAEQCANIIHNNGKIDVKRGSVEKLLPIYTALIDNKLTAKIE